MRPTEMSRVKNAPLSLPDDRDEFVACATSVPDGNISAGHQPVHYRLLEHRPSRLLRASGAGLVSLARRESNRTPDQVAAVAGVPVADVVPLEHGDAVTVETVTRVANALCLNGAVIAQLFGFGYANDSRLIDAATELVVQLGTAEPLHPREAQALDRFRTALATRPEQAVAK